MLLSDVEFLMDECLILILSWCEEFVYVVCGYFVSLIYAFVFRFIVGLFIVLNFVLNFMLLWMFFVVVVDEVWELSLKILLLLSFLFVCV